jgi:hypothetical protein
MSEESGDDAELGAMFETLINRLNSMPALGGKRTLEDQAREKLTYFAALTMLTTQLRRTDAEMRHLTGDRDIKAMETDLLRVLTLVRSLTYAYAVYQAMTITTPFGELGLGEQLFTVASIAMAGASSAGVMTELS